MISLCVCLFIIEKQIHIHLSKCFIFIFFYHHLHLHFHVIFLFLWNVVCFGRIHWRMNVKYSNVELKASLSKNTFVVHSSFHFCRLYSQITNFYSSKYIIRSTQVPTQIFSPQYYVSGEFFFVSFRISTRNFTSTIQRN